MANIKKIASDLNWELDKRNAYGVYKGFTITLIQNFSMTNSQDVFKLLFIPMAELDKSQTEALNNFIMINKKELRFMNYMVETGLLSARFLEGFKQINSENLIVILDMLVAEFARLGIEPKSKCVYCNEEGSDTITYVNKIKFPAHQTCKSEAIEKNMQTKKELSNIKNSFSSYIGALVGAIVGVIPHLIAVWFGWFIGILTFLTGFVAYKGFQLLGGKTIPSTKYIVSAISFLIILLSNVFLMEVIAFLNGVTLMDVLSVAELQSAFLQSLGMSALFGLLGVGAVYSKIKKDEYSTEVE